MGIKNLNRFLRNNCTTSSIHKVNIKDMVGKIIVIDTSIYMYKFMSENALMENMYLLISILKTHSIVPIFIFDGKPPPEKLLLLKQRRLDKKTAEQKYLILESELANQDTELSDEQQLEEKREIQLEMNRLKRRFVKIRNDDICNVKSLMRAYGVAYHDAPGEADVLCAYFVKSGKAWACMSDDMDMFLYGCPMVIRNISLMKQTAILHNMNAILEDLKMTPTEFCEIMVLSGTDYDIHSRTNLDDTIRWYVEYNKYRLFCTKHKNNPVGFYIWLLKNTKYIKDYRLLINNYQLFQFEFHKELENWQTIDGSALIQCNETVRTIMEKDGFVFASK